MLLLRWCYAVLISSIEVLASVGWLQVYLGQRSAGGQKVALKVLSAAAAGPATLNRLRREVGLMRHVSRDANVVQFYGASLQHAANAVLVMEWVQRRCPVDECLMQPSSAAWYILWCGVAAACCHMRMRNECCTTCAGTVLEAICGDCWAMRCWASRCCGAMAAAAWHSMQRAVWHTFIPVASCTGGCCRFALTRWVALVQFEAHCCA